MKKIILSVLFIFSLFYSLSQARYGLPAYKTFKPDDYKSHPQIFNLLQLPDGKVWLGTYQGISSYDGDGFSIINKDYMPVRASFYDTSTSRIYVGGDISFGYFYKDSIGGYEFKDFSKKLPEEYKNFVVVLGIERKDNKIYFFAFNKIFVYDQNDSLIKIIPSKTSFRYSYRIDDRIFTYEIGVGLDELVDDTVKLVKETSIFSDGRIFGLTKLNDSIALFTANLPVGCIYKWNFISGEISKVNTYADKYFERYKPKTIKIFRNGEIGVGTSGGGFVMLKPDFSLDFIFNYENGLPDDEVYDILEDKSGNIFISTNNGFSILYDYNGVSYVNLDANGIKYIPVGSVIKDSVYYVVTLGGLYKFGLDKFPSKSNNYLNLYPFPGNPIIKDSYLDILKAKNGDIFLTASNNLAIIRNGEYKLLQRGFYASVLSNSIYHRNVMFVTHALGLVIYKYEHNSWNLINDKMKVNTQCRYIYEYDKKNIFVSTLNSVLYHLRFKDTLLNDFTLTKINFEKYLNRNIPILFHYKDTLFSFVYGGHDSTQTLYLDVKNDTLIKWHYYVKYLNNSTVNDLPGYNVNYQLYEDSLMILRCNYNLTNVKIKNDTIYIDSYPFRTMKRSGSTSLNYDKKTKLYWGTTTDYIFNIRPDYSFKGYTFRTLIDYVVLSNDSIVALNNINPKLVLPYEYNGVIFYFSAPFFSPYGKIKYRYFLEGFDKKWSALTPTNFTKYTNLPPGDYIFRVKAVNVYKDESEEATFRFTVLPPWYMTWWAYMIYVILFIIIVIVVARLYSMKLKADNEKLEWLVKERTKKIREQHNLIRNSIEYAKKIQEAVVPNEKQLKRVFEKSFMIFKPRDIVSGDFLWFHKISGDEYLIAVADCTGHGVPGAFMSMIGNTLLNEIIKVHKIYSPDKILKELHKGVKDALHRDEKLSLTFDGMDIVVTRLNIKVRKLQLASAGEYAFVFTDSEFHLINGDLFSIGDPLARDNDIAFNLIELAYKDQLKLYFSSDGYFDQFGGGNHKKFGIKNFIALLERVKDLPLEKQKKTVEEEFEVWKGNNKQIDDIIVVGINI